MIYVYDISVIHEDVRMDGAILRGGGVNASERKLGKLTDRTFLRLWSYPNTFNDRNVAANGIGQEFADLLAVFENHVVIFSDKQAQWSETKPLEVAWPRWYRKAVHEAVKQLRGASSWLEKHPGRIFTDKECTQKLPIPLPPKQDRIVHLVAVVGGAEQAARDYFGDQRGTLVLRSTIKGRDHFSPSDKRFSPFEVGDVDPSGPFIHVFDPIGLNFAMTELDTVADFTNYLTQRSRLLRFRYPVTAMGEEHLVSAYMMNGFIDNKPSFIPKKLKKKARRSAIVIPEGEYETYTNSRLYSELSRLREGSEMWDRTIELISESVLEGSSIEILNSPPSVKQSELVLREMASETRMNRVQLGEALRGAMNQSIDDQTTRFVRRTLIRRERPARMVGYVFLMLPYDPNFGSIEEYREYRSKMLATYCLSFLREQPKLKRATGLAFDLQHGGASGYKFTTRSEDLIAIEMPRWDSDLLDTLEHDRKLFDMKDHKTLKASGRKLRIRNTYSVDVNRKRYR